MDPRHLRQVLLQEIGPAGQARIAAATARVLSQSDAGPALEHSVAEAYARGAGFAALAPGAIDVGALAPASIVAAPPARAVLAGARAALAAMRAALDPEPQPWTQAGATAAGRAPHAGPEDHAP